MKAETAIILAAGRGSRMHSETPTALHAVAGRPIIDWMLGEMESCIKMPPVIVDRPGQEIAAHVGERARYAVQALGLHSLVKVQGVQCTPVLLVVPSFKRTRCCLSLSS